MAAGKSIVILGGGIGGIIAADVLRKRLPREHRVIMVERDMRHVFAPSLLWLMVGKRRESAISRGLTRHAKLGVEVVQGEIEHIDPQTRSVTVNGATLHADYMIVALGAEFAPETVPGLSEAGHNFYTLAGARSLNHARQEFRDGRLVVLVAGMPFKCPGAPYEGAMLLNADIQARGVGDRVKVEFFTPEPGPMPVAGPQVSAAVRRMVEGCGIAVHTEHQVERIDPATRQIHFKNGATTSFDLLAYVPPHRAPAVVRQSGLTSESGWVPVDRHTLETRFPGVFAIGDVTTIPLVTGKPLPKAGVFAHGQAEVVADNIVRDLTGEGEARTFDGHGACFIETGHNRAGFGSGNFYAEPAPQVRLRAPSMLLHLAKVVFEKTWLYRRL
jgi:sulfide:quinone oxidoreductase